MPSILDFFRPVPKEERGAGSQQSTQAQVESALADRKRPRASRPASYKPDKRRANVTVEGISSKDDDTQRSRKRQSTRKASKKLEKTEADAKAAAVESSGPLELSEYELKRQAKMAANAKFLQELGMTHAQMQMTSQLQGGSLVSKRKKKLVSNTREPVGTLGPVRRSMRLRGGTTTASKSKADASLDDDGVGSDVQSDTILEPSFDDSTVLRYTCASGASKQMTPTAVKATLGDSESAKTLVGFTFGEESYLTDPALKKVYAMSFSPFQENGLIAAGGHQGHVSIYPMPTTSSSSQREAEAADGDEAHGDSVHVPLMSFKAHSGWISNVSLAKSVFGEKNLLLTAANDAIVKLWDLNRSSSVLRSPKELYASSAQHSKGIFGLDVCGDAVVTCSKDATIAFSLFRDHSNELEVVRRFQDHEGVVKSVRFATTDPQRFASGGNDRTLRVFDVRLPDAKAAALVIPNAHSRAINSVAFHPMDEHLLLSASFDPDFHLFDLRKPSTPACTFHGPPRSGGGSSAIYHPIFVHEGREVVAACGYEVSLYRTSDGVTVSRGAIDKKADYIAADPFQNRLVLAGSARLQFADHRWEDKVA
ncbi:hypothetical protein BBJ28_00009448 [Nothophytophthora sp. Chile5]|nr:hypothetical protein BBJ28_00009448 [Nothophytophthora sp. Chile5]